MFAVRKSTPVIPRDIGHDDDLFGREPSQFTMGDQVVRMLVVLPLIDQVADVMENCGKFEPLALDLAEIMQPFGLVEESQRQTRDVEAMDFRNLASPRQSQHVAASQIRYVGLGFDPLTMADDE